MAGLEMLAVVGLQRGISALPRRPIQDAGRRPKTRVRQVYLRAAGTQSLAFHLGCNPAPAVRLRFRQISQARLMMAKFRPTDSAVQEEARAFIRSRRTLVMATCGADGRPEASYAPFVRREGLLYVYLSELARHSANLGADGRLSVLFIEDEQDTPQPFARRRLTLACAAERVTRDSPSRAPTLDSFTVKFGELMDLLKTLQDFDLFRIRAHDGLFVRGFGQAFRLEPASIAGMIGDDERASISTAPRGEAG